MPSQRGDLLVARCASLDRVRKGLVGETLGGLYAHLQRDGADRDRGRPVVDGHLRRE